MGIMRTGAIAIIAALLLAGPCMAQDEMIQIKGSDTLINLVQLLAEDYLAKNPDAVISVTGGGSGTGIAALLNKRCDIANASRGIKEKEITRANSLGIEPKRIIVAIDGLSVIVNAENPVKKLTVDEIGKIYKGEITDWSQVGGNKGPITLYGRQSNSGTYDFMKKSVLRGEYSPSMKSMNGNAQIVEGVKQDASGIGYVGVGYAKGATGITTLEVAKDPATGYYSPFNTEDVKTGKYPISRPLNQYVNGTPAGAVAEFIKFELSPEGQKIVVDEGFFALSREYQKLNAETLGG